MYPCVGMEMGKGKCGTVQSKPLGSACLRQDRRICATVLMGEKVKWARELGRKKGMSSFHKMLDQLMKMKAESEYWVI